MNTPLKISDEAREVADREITRLKQVLITGSEPKGYHVQLAINKAVAETYRKAAEVCRNAGKEHFSTTLQAHHFDDADAILNLIPKE